MITKLEGSCPDCGCTTVHHESRCNQHTNGEWNEERMFRCGRTTAYVPNYRRVNVTEQCRTAQAKTRAAREAVKDRTREAARTAASALGVEADWLDQLLKAIEYVRA